ncbi:hypothetical protein HDZ31DRAFT_68071 [Schizophyllum fasciatum]
MAAENHDPTGFDPSATMRDYSNVNLPVYPCSARDYMRLRKLIPGDSKRTTFSTLEDTGIPAIAAWILDLSHCGIDNRAIHKLELGKAYIDSVRNFCEDGSGCGSDAGLGMHSGNNFFVREGYYVNRERRVYDLNWVEVETMFKHIAGGWNRIFSADKIAPLAQQCRTIMDDAFALLPAHVRSHRQGSAVYASCCEQARVTFSGISDSSTAQLDKGQRTASGLLKPSVQKRLLPGYKEALVLPKGKGIVQRQKDFFADHVEQWRPYMFHQAAQEMLEKLRGTTDKLEKSLVREMEVFAQQIEVNMATLWEQNDGLDAEEMETRRRVAAITARYTREIDSLLRAASAAKSTKQLSHSMRSMSFADL